MSKKIIFVIFLVITTVVVLYINHRIASYDLRFYSGKDDGYFVRFGSICLLSTIYFALMTDRNKIMDALIGLAFGFIAGIIGYLVSMLTIPDPLDGIGYYFISCFLFMLMFFILQKLRKSRIGKELR